MSQLIAISAHTRYRNTKESDRQDTVMHVVNLSDGTQREILASDPMEAINSVNHQLRRENQQQIQP